MKTLSTLSIALAIVAGSASAQNPVTKPDNRWGFGVFAGVNYSFSKVGRSFPIRRDAQSGWLLGIDINHALNDWSSLRIQPSLARSSSISRDILSVAPSFDITSLKIPVLYRFHILPTHKSLFIEGGGAYNRIVASNYRKEEVAPCLIPPCQTYYRSEVPALNKSAVSIIGGVGINIAVQKVTIPVALRYERYISSYAFPSLFEQNPATTVSFQNVSLTTGVNF